MYFKENNISLFYIMYKSSPIAGLSFYIQEDGYAFHHALQ